MKPANPRRPTLHARISHLILISLLLASCGGGAGGSAGSGPDGGPIDSPDAGPSVPPPARTARWSATPVRIDSPSATGAADRPALVTDSAGNVTAVWTQVHNGRIGINGNSYRAAAASWGEPVALHDPDAGDAGRPALAVDSTGNVMVMWSQASSQGTATIHARRFDLMQGRWGAIEQVRTAPSAQRPVLVVDGMGGVTAVWQEEDPDTGSRVLAGSRRLQGAWSTPLRLSGPDAFGPLGDAVLVAGPQGTVVAAWAEEPLAGNSFIIIRASHFDGTGWSEPARIDSPMAAPSESYAYAPSLATDGAGHVTAAWIQTDLTDYFVGASRFDGQAWTTPTRISSAATVTGDFVRVAADAAGNVTAVWNEFTEDNDHLLSSSRFDSLAGEWSAPVRINHTLTGLLEIPDAVIAAGADGNLVAAWTAFTTHPIIASSRYVAATQQWEAPLQIDASADGGNVASPAITLDGSGRATAAWVKVQSGLTAIMANRFE